MGDGARVIVDFRTEPARYRHWKLAVDGPVATLAMDVREDGGLVPGYELKLNSYDLGVDIELYDAMQRLRFEHPEVGAVVLTSGKERIFCAGANIRMLEPVLPRLEGELLQVHQRDAQRHRGGDRGVAPDLDLRGERALRGRRLRAGAGLRAHRDGRRRLHHRVAAGGAAAGGAPGHRRAHPPRGQAACAAGPGGLLLHARGGHQGPAGGGVAAGGRGGAALPAGGDGAPARRASAPPRSDRPADARGIALVPTGADDRRATTSPTAT